MSTLDLHGDLRAQLRAIFDARRKTFRRLDGHAWIMHPATWEHLVERRVAGPLAAMLGYDVVLDEGVTEGRVYFVEPARSAR